VLRSIAARRDLSTSHCSIATSVRLPVCGTATQNSARAARGTPARNKKASPYPAWSTMKPATELLSAAPAHAAAVAALAQLAQFRFGLAGRFAAWALIDQGVGC
jgi:hypothetical protein